MKLVIQTQIRENYAAHQGFNGEYYWKCKGGNSYVVANLTPAQAERVVEDGIPTLKALVEERSDYFEEFIIDWSVLDNDAVVCEEWESPIQLSWQGGRWTAIQVRENDEYGYMRQDIARQITTWDLLMGGERENTVCTYVMRDGKVVKASDLQEAA